MTQILLRLFVKDHENTDDPAVRSAIGSLSGFVGILANLLLFALKLLIGIITCSVSVTADAMNNLSDASSAIVTLLGFRLASRPADEDHPYGHARYEYLSGLAVAVMIMVIGFELGKTSVEKIISPSSVIFSPTAAIVLLASIGVKLWLSLFNSSLARRIRSTTLEATAADSRNDCLATGAVLLAMVVEYFTRLQIDGYVGLGVALFILVSGWNLARETISPLLGEGASQELREKIVEQVKSHPLVLGYHDLMVHDYGPGQRFASLHVEMDQKKDPIYCHEVIDDLERECYQTHGVHLVIHYDPVVVDDPELDRMRKMVTDLLLMKDERLSIHDFRMVPGQGHTNLIFDVSLPLDLKGQETAIQRGLERALNDMGRGTYYTVITFDPAVFNQGN